MTPPQTSRMFGGTFLRYTVLMVLLERRGLPVPQAPKDQPGLKAWTVSMGELAPLGRRGHKEVPVHQARTEAQELLGVQGQPGRQAQQELMASMEGRALPGR